MVDLPWGLYAGAGKSIAAGIDGAVKNYQERERKRTLADIYSNPDLSTTEGALAASRALLQKGFTKEGMTLAELAMGNRREMRAQTNQDRQFEFQRENAQAGRTLQQQQFELQRQAANRREMPAGYESDGAGGMRPIRGGPASPEAIARNVQARKSEVPLSASSQKAIMEADETVMGAESAIETLKKAKTLSKQALGFPGAARVALGPDLPALFSNDDALSEGLLRAGLAVRDPLWRLPLHDGYDVWLDSPFADMSNVSQKPMAGAVTAALFLRRFVPEGQPWAHLDVYAWNDAARPGRPEGGEAQSARAIFKMLQKFTGVKET
jgi:hypothetical protein